MKKIILERGAIYFNLYQLVTIAGNYPLKNKLFTDNYRFEKLFFHHTANMSGPGAVLFNPQSKEPTSSD